MPLKHNLTLIWWNFCHAALKSVFTQRGDNTLWFMHQPASEWHVVVQYWWHRWAVKVKSNQRSVSKHDWKEPFVIANVVLHRATVMSHECVTKPDRCVPTGDRNEPWICHQTLTEMGHEGVNDCDQTRRVPKVDRNEPRCGHTRLCSQVKHVIHKDAVKLKCVPQGSRNEL